MANTFLLQENGGYLLQENGGKLIIGQTPEIEGGGSARNSNSIQKGVSAVKIQLGDKPKIKFTARVIGKLAGTLSGRVTSKLYVKPKPKPEIYVSFKGHAISKLLIREECIIHAKLLTYESFVAKSSLLYKESCKTIGTILQHPYHELSETLQLIHTEITTEKEARIKLAKEVKIEKLLEKKRILLEEIRKTPSIQVTLNSDIHQRGDLIRITSNMSEQSSQIWMRIIDNKGLIVQKPGLVKKNAAGFQVLIGSRDLKAGKYIIQVSNHASFSPLGVAEFEVKGEVPINPAIAIIPGLLTPDSPQQEYKKVRFRTMMDSRVDAVCRQYENRIFDAKDKNLPVPPIHYNCRCYLEGVDSVE